ncbi:MAG TPA: response regulator transcription factor [Polyangia bacterium]|jgi:DNA-binding response OmpR family regulator|nr:response regulator transcription factor [Polyangia bacterium]
MLVALVEDDPFVAETLQAQLEETGLRVEVIPTGAEALTRFERHDLDAAIIDLGLPDMDGADVIAQARARGMWAPILVASARLAVDERVRVLGAGADDYVVKPVAGAEITARLSALRRRATGPRWAPLACERISLSEEGRRAMVDGRPVKLSPSEHALLRILLRRRGHVVTRNEILTDVLGYRTDPGTNVVDVHVTHLRRKIAAGGVAIEAVRGVGFRLERRDG